MMKRGFKCLRTRQRESEDGITPAEETPCWIRKGMKGYVQRTQGFRDLQVVGWSSINLTCL